MPNVFLAHTLRYTDDILKIKDEKPYAASIDESPLSYTVDDEEKRIHITDIFEFERQQALAQEQQAHALNLQNETTEQPALSLDTQLLAQEMLEAAEAEAEQIKERVFQTAMADQERILLQARQEADLLLENAKTQGMQQGLDEGGRLLKAQLDELEHTIARLEGDLAGFEVELEEQLRWMALEVASRVLAHKVQEDDAVLIDMVANTVQSVRNMPWIRIEVAQNMTHLIKKLQDLYDEQEHIEISPIPAEEDVIQIETPSGRLDASVKTQLENLRVYFQKNSD